MRIVYVSRAVARLSREIRSNRTCERGGGGVRDALPVDRVGPM